ncbi:hypothetical protein D3C76_1487720 [compost metagenome]
MQLQAFHLSWGRTLDRRPAQLATQPGQDTQQVLLFRGVLRCLFGLARQVKGQWVLTAAFQHTDHAQARAGIHAVPVQGQRGAEITGALARLAHLE